MDQNLLEVLIPVGVFLPFVCALAVGILNSLNLTTPLFKLTWLPPAAIFVTVVWASLPGSISPSTFTTISLYESLGIHLSWRVDGFSLLMGMLISGIGALICAYGYGYLKTHPGLCRFYVLLYAFMGAMLGLVFSDNLISLFVFWEITTLVSYLLVGFNHTNETSRRNALQALLVTGMGGLLLLAGILWLGHIASTFELSAMQADMLANVTPTSLTVIASLILIACFTKSAQFPFHFWLPNAMAAPTPVSAYLHSATMVKAGVYLIYRFSPIFADLAVWQYALLIAGGTTMVFSAVCSLIYFDLKKILAYTTLSVLGLLVFLAGIGSDIAMTGALLVLLAHALYKAALFMIVGAVDHECGTRDVTILGKLGKLMPLTAVAAAVAALSQAGVFPLMGFVAKEYSYKAGLKSPESVIVMTVLIAASACLVAAACIVGHHIFFSSRASLNTDQLALKGKPHDPTLWMSVPPMILGCATLVSGLAATSVAAWLITPALHHLGVANPAPVKLWAGINLALILSILTLSLGIIIYVFRHRLWSMAQKVAGDVSFRFDAGFASLIQRFIQLSQWQTGLVQNGSLRSYLLMSVAGFLCLASVGIVSLKTTSVSLDFANVRPLDVVLCLVISVGALAAAYSQSLIRDLMALGVVGFCLPLVYLRFGAVDLVLTLVLVEVLMAVMFMAVIYKLPRVNHITPKRTQLINAAVACVFGGLFVFLILNAQSIQLQTPISDEMGALSYLEAKGKNVVNVILVDFRALDTLGEITVLLLAALGSAILLQRHRKGGNAS